MQPVIVSASVSADHIMFCASSPFAPATLPFGECWPPASCTSTALIPIPKVPLGRPLYSNDPDTQSALLRDCCDQEGHQTTAEFRFSDLISSAVLLSTGQA